MPIYQRKCNECDHEEELLESIHAEDIIVCKKCGKKTFKKVIVNTSFRMNRLMNDNVSNSYK